MYKQTELEYHILSDFQQALHNGDIVFYLQPQCRISDKKIVGAEALVRWIKPDGRIVPPLEFIPTLEKCGFITDMDQYIWEEVCKFQRKLLDSGKQPIPISLNVSMVNIFNTDVADFFEKLVEKYKLPPKLIKIEITESAYTDNTELVKDTIKRLGKVGFLVLMDDFGSGYSSLNMLQSLNVDIVKLDANFLRMNNSHYLKGIHILESVINMTKTMALPTIVEGVETEAQTKFLEDLGCRYAQGYYFYKPMDAQSLEKLIEDPNNVDNSGITAAHKEQFSIREFLDRNVYSDSMLNNILGPIAFYARHGDDIDIVRFNQQFYDMVNISDFHNRLSSIQNFLPEEDLQLMYQLMDSALEDKLNGASGLLRFYNSDGSLSHFLTRFYYIGETDNEQRFYGSVQDITEFTQLQNNMKLLSDYSSDTVVFLTKGLKTSSFKVIINGLEQYTGLDSKELEAELNSGFFFKRIANDDHKEKIKKISKESRQNGEGFAFSFSIKNNNGKNIDLYLKTDPVKDCFSLVEYILVFRTPLKT